MFFLLLLHASVFHFSFSCFSFLLLSSTGIQVESRQWWGKSKSHSTHRPRGYWKICSDTAVSALTFTQAAVWQHSLPHPYTKQTHTELDCATVESSHFNWGYSSANSVFQWHSQFVQSWVKKTVRGHFSLVRTNVQARLVLFMSISVIRLSSEMIKSCTRFRTKKWKIGLGCVASSDLEVVWSCCQT